MFKAGDIAKSKPKTDEEKYLWWDSICNRLLDSYEKQRKAEAISDIEYQMLVGEIRGGMKCPTCKISWAEIRFNDAFGMGLYYKPLCGCSPRCPACRRSLHIEHAAGKLVDKAWCDYCGSPISLESIRKQFEKTDDHVIQRQIYMRRRNVSGTTCTCGHDLWYERKADILYCQKCDRKLPEVSDERVDTSSQETV